ncbi:MAG: class I SAM-dependent methyltransferase [Chloroflexi bacterium]|nr:class I SAM-dependent methyltransferase [Chloroflexota bacterium]
MAASEASSPTVAEIVARYYDLEHEGLTADVALYAELARRAQGPVLELGCGTGRILAPLARAGASVVGIEISPPMVARARARLAHSAVSPGQWQVVQADARTLRLPDRFALVLAPLDFLAYFPAQADQRAVLATARRHLLPTGQLVIDVSFPPTSLHGQPEGVLVHQWTHREADGSTITKSWVREIDPAAQVQHLRAFYELAQPDGLLRRWVHALSLRYYYRFELELLLAGSGFAVDGVYGSYALEPLQADSARLLITARPDGGL